MKKIIRLTESDLTRIVRRVISEQSNQLINLDGTWWKYKDGDSLKYGGKKVDVTMVHVPPKGGQSLGEKVWTVGCDKSITPKVTGQTNKLMDYASISSQC
jgi:hypothetical protein